MSCNDEHEHSHGHGHGHAPPPETSEGETLFPHIDLQGVRSMNVANSNDVPLIIRPWNERFEETPIIESDLDEELIIVIPFSGTVKLHSLLFRSLGDETSPQEIKLYKNQPQISFDTLSQSAVTQELTHPAGIGMGISTSEGNGGIVEFALNRPKFANTKTLSIFVQSNYGAEQTKLAYIGVRGEFSQLKQEPVKFQYELVANPKDLRTRSHGDKNRSKRLS